MTREQAEANAQELNRELGAHGDEQSYYIAVESAPGVWRTEKRTERKSWLKRILDALLNYSG